MISEYSSIPAAIQARIQQARQLVWTPGDFVDIGSRASVDKALQRMVKSGLLRRIDRGLYDMPAFNPLTKKHTVPDYRAVIDAVKRRDKVRCVVDGMTAANTLGMTNAVPAKIEVLVDARLKPIQLGNQRIVFKHSAPSRLYWAERPGMYIVQALYWIHDVMDHESELTKVGGIIRKLLRDEKEGAELAGDLRAGLSAMPIWMQDILRAPLDNADKEAKS